MKQVHSVEHAPSEVEAISSTFSLSIRPDNIAVIAMDVPGEKMNTLKSAFAEQVQTVLRQAQQHAALRGVILISGKPDSFVVGADISMLDACTRAEEAGSTGAARAGDICRFW